MSGPRVASPATEAILTAKIPAAVVTRLRAEAHRHDRTLSGQIRHVLKQWAEAGGPINA